MVCENYRIKNNLDKKLYLLFRRNYAVLNIVATTVYDL